MSDVLYKSSFFSRYVTLLYGDERLKWPMARYLRDYSFQILPAHINPLRRAIYTGVLGGERGSCRPQLEKFLGNLCFQSKRKLLKNPEW